MHTTVVRAVGLLLAIVSTVLTVRYTCVIWAHGKALRAETAQIENPVTVTGDIRASEILNERLYTPGAEGHAAAVSGQATLVIVTRSGCVTCDQSLDVWNRRFAGMTKAPAVNVRIIAYDNRSRADALMATLDRLSVPYRVTTVADPSTFGEVIGIERLPLALVIANDRVSCVLEGVAADAATGSCLAAVDPRAAMYVQHTASTEPAFLAAAR
jgi:hypothetical protein